MTMAAISSRVRSLRVLCFIVTLLSRCYKMLEISKVFCDNIVTFSWGMSMQFFRFFVSNVRIRASALLFSSINCLLFPSLLQNYEAHTQAITKPASKKQDAGSVSGSNARTRAPAVCSKLRHGLVPDIQSAAEPCDHDRHLLARGAALRLKAQAARAGMPLISPRSHAQFMAVRA